MSRRVGRLLGEKHILVALTLAVITVLAGVIFWRLADESGFRFGDRTLTIEAVSSERDKQTGLGGRKSIDENYGMLFVYDKSGTYCFWMKNMLVPIDMLWLDEDKRVVHVEQNVSPESYPESFCPPEPARYVLEVRAGLSQRAGVDVGSQL